VSNQQPDFLLHQDENAMLNPTHDIRLQPRWTCCALAGAPGLLRLSAACGERGVGVFSIGMTGSEVAREPGRARFGRHDT
jgi:hypothetical protein